MQVGKPPEGRAEKLQNVLRKETNTYLPTCLSVCLATQPAQMCIVYLNVRNITSPPHRQIHTYLPADRQNLEHDSGNLTWIQHASQKETQGNGSVIREDRPGPRGWVRRAPGRPGSGVQTRTGPQPTTCSSGRNTLCRRPEQRRTDRVGVQTVSASRAERQLLRLRRVIPDPEFQLQPHHRHR